MVWLTCLLLLPCSLAYKQYATSRSHPDDFESKSGTLVTVNFSDLSVPPSWTDWSLSAWIFIDGATDSNIQTTSPAHKLEMTGESCVLSGDNIDTQLMPVTASLTRKWHMLILGSNQEETYASIHFRDQTLGMAAASGLNGGVPAPANPFTTFQVMSGVTLFSVRVM